MNESPGFFGNRPRALPKPSIPCSVALLRIQVDDIASFHFRRHFMKKLYPKRSNPNMSITCIILPKVFIYSWALLPPYFHPTCISKPTKRMTSTIMTIMTTKRKIHYPHTHRYCILIMTLVTILHCRGLMSRNENFPPF